MCEKQTKQKTPPYHIRLVGKYALNHFVLLYTFLFHSLVTFRIPFWQHSLHDVCCVFLQTSGFEGILDQPFQWWVALLLRLFDTIPMPLVALIVICGILWLRRAWTVFKPPLDWSITTSAKMVCNEEEKDESILAVPVVIGWKPVQKEELVKNAVFSLLAGMRS